MTLPRYLIDRIFEQIVNNGYADKWNYATQAAREFDAFVKSGKTLSPNNTFLKPCRFSKFNSLTQEDVHTILYPAFLECRELLVDAALEDLDSFMMDIKAQIQTQHSKAIYARGNPLEDYGRQLVSIALFGFFRKDGFVYQEVPSGKGFIDILICTDREIIVEAKLASNFDPASKQLNEYVRAGRNRKGYYFVFDTTESFTSRKYCDIENGRFPPKDRYAVIVCHVNPPKPSSI